MESSAITYQSESLAEIRITLSAYYPCNFLSADYNLNIQYRPNNVNSTNETTVIDMPPQRFHSTHFQVFEKLKDVRSARGYTLSNAIMTGVVTPHLGVGATAGDEDCWDTFKDLYYPIIKEWHGYDAETQVQLTP